MHRKLIPDPFLILLNNPKQSLHARTLLKIRYFEREFSKSFKKIQLYFSFEPHVIRVSFLCHSYVIVYHPYATRIYSYVIRMSLVWTCMSSVSIRMSSICHSYVIRMSLVCHPYVTRMSSVCHSYVICISLVCTRVSLVCTRMSFVCTRISSICHSYVLVCHLYVFVCHQCDSYIIRMSHLCTRMSSACHSYVPVCNLYVTRMYSYIIRMSLVCGFTINL